MITVQAKLPCVDLLIGKCEFQFRQSHRGLWLWFRQKLWNREKALRGIISRRAIVFRKRYSFSLSILTCRIISRLFCFASITCKMLLAGMLYGYFVRLKKFLVIMVDCNQWMPCTNPRLVLQGIFQHLVPHHLQDGQSSTNGILILKANDSIPKGKKKATKVKNIYIHTFIASNALSYFCFQLLREKRSSSC